jgi:hypothetical protein
MILLHRCLECLKNYFHLWGLQKSLVAPPLGIYLHRKMQVMGLLLKTIHNIKLSFFYYISWFTTSQRIWDTDLGVIWDPDLGVIWDPDLSPHFGTPIWDPDLGGDMGPEI